MRAAWLMAVVSAFALTSVADARGPGAHGRHGGHDDDHRTDMQRFHVLLDRRADIVRTVKEIPGGVETLTESSDPEVAAHIRQHVADMERRIKERRPIHLRDPLFAEIFRHADAITMKLEPTAQGLRVIETSQDAYVTKLIRAHARVVTGFLENGHAEMRRNHPVPER